MSLADHGAKPRETSLLVRGLAGSMGFALCGVTSAAKSQRAGAFADWLAEGRHGTMAWLERTPEARVDPAAVLPGARSVIVVADQYATRNDAEDAVPAWHGRVARYARGRDYHTVMKRRLHLLCDALRERFPGERCRAFVDTAPVLERDLAERAGLGWIGKNTMLIHPRRGSYLLLGGIITTLALETVQERVEDHCGTCTRCLDACPTSCLTPYRLDATRCISYLTIEHRGPIDPGLHGAMGGWVFGCDVCQEVCPHNSPRGEEHAGVGGAHAAYRPSRSSFDLLDVLGWDETARRARVSGTPMTRAKLPMWKRNAAIAAGNGLATNDSPELLEALERLADDASEDVMVRAAAVQVLQRAGHHDTDP